jgi:hypothetical protein
MRAYGPGNRFQDGNVNALAGLALHIRCMEPKELPVGDGRQIRSLGRAIEIIEGAATGARPEGTRLA